MTTLKRTWPSAISERISASNDHQTVAVQQNVYGNWYGYINGHRAKMFYAHENNEDSAVKWLLATLEGKS